MFELIAEGPRARQRWRNPLIPGVTYTLGRDVETDLPVPWDPQISRRHVRLIPRKNGVAVERLPDAKNPLFFEGSAVDECRLVHNGQFVLGSTAFHIVAAHEEQLSPGHRPVEEVTFSRQQLQKIRYRDADKRIEVLTHLPEVIWGSRSESDLYHRLVNLLLAGVARAEAIAVVELREDDSVRVCHWERRRETAGEFRPSARLVVEAVRNRHNSVLHVWEASNPEKHDYTAMAEFDWAFCTPIAEPKAAPWGIYVAGKLDRATASADSRSWDGYALQADVKFTELVAAVVGAVQRVNKLERQRAGYRQFFAPPILSALGNDWESTDLLEPRECDVTVMFCDLRGFSQQAEIASDDLIGLLDRVSSALGVMTKHILQHGGVTGDFQGDAALGFWGWPFASSQAPLDACRAALRIRAEFARTFRQPGHPLANFQMGIGIAHGRAVAGKIGTADHVKVTVFGPVVNLASRLENMTKQLRVPILLDEATSKLVRNQLDSSEGRIRRLACVLPYGMENPVFVSELLPPQSEMPDLTDEHLQQYEQGVECFVGGRWEEAYRCLHAMPASDRAQDFLTLLIAQHNRTPPADWDGIVRLPSK